MYYMEHMDNESIFGNLINRIDYLLQNERIWAVIKRRRQRQRVNTEHNIEKLLPSNI